MLALAWPGSPGFGLALDGLGFVKSQAGPKAEMLAWLGRAWLWPRPGPITVIFGICDFLKYYLIYTLQVQTNVVLF